MFRGSDKKIVYTLLNSESDNSSSDNTNYDDNVVFLSNSSVEDELDALLATADIEEQTGYELQQPGLWGSIKRTTGNIAKSTGNGIVSAGKFVKKHPILIPIAAVTALANSANALFGPSGQNPSEIDSLSIWWNAMSTGKKAYSVISAISSELVNGTMNALFLPALKDKLKSNLSDMFKTPGNFFSTVTAMLLGLSSGVAAGAMAFNAFVFLGIAGAIPFGSIALVVTFASRYISIKKLINRMMNKFNKDAKAQEKLADQLDHINKQFKQTLEIELDQIIEKLNLENEEILTGEHYEEILKELAITLDQFDMLIDGFINKKTDREYTAEYLLMAFDVLVALPLAAVTFATFTQKGFDGVSIISKATSGNSLEDIDNTYKILIGMWAGLPSAVFYFDSAYNFRQDMMKVGKKIYNDPKLLIPASFLTAAIYFSSESMAGVTKGIVNKDNIFSVTDNALGTTWVVLQQIAAGLVNGGSSMRKTFLGRTDEGKSETSNEVTIESLNSRLHGMIKDGQVISQFGMFGGQINNQANGNISEEILDSSDQNLNLNQI